jgi:hypothetical protein
VLVRQLNVMPHSSMQIKRGNEPHYCRLKPFPFVLFIFCTHSAPRLLYGHCMSLANEGYVMQHPIHERLKVFGATVFFSKRLQILRRPGRLQMSMSHSSMSL